MAKVDKKAIILECIISEYIKTSAPVGSEHLQSVMDMEVSSATIRNYLKKMVEDGVLIQFHISGGRAPSFITLKQFWLDRLSKIDEVAICDVSSAEDASREYKIASIIQMNESDKLLSVYFVASKYIVAEFESGEVLFRGDFSLKSFLEEMIGLESSQILNLAIHYGVFEIQQKLSEYLTSKRVEVLNKEELFEMAKFDPLWAKEKMSWFLDGRVASRVGHGIYFQNLIPEGFMAVKTDAKIGDKNAQMLYLGHLSRDFGGFLCALS